MREAAALLGVSPNTLRRAEESGVIPCVRSPGGHRRYRRRDLDKLLAAGGLRGVPRAPAASPDDGDGAHGEARSETADLARRVSELTAKVELAQEINGLLGADPRHLLGAIARRLAQHTGCPICTIYAVEDERLRVLVSFEDGAFDEAWEGRVCELSFWPPAEEALRRRLPCVVTDKDDPRLSEATRTAMKAWSCGSTLTIPLVVDDVTIGLVELSDHVPRDYAGELALACDLAQTAAHAIRNARLLQRVEHANTVLAALVELGAFIAQTHDVEAVASAVTERLRDVVGVAYCEIYLLEGGRLRFIAGHTDAAMEDWFGWNDELTRYPTCAAAVASGDVLVVTSPDDPRLNEIERREFTDYGLVSEIAVPLIVDERVVGMIDLFDKRERDYAEYVDFLRSVGQMVAGLLRNALLFTEVERHNAMLGELVEIGAIASHSRDIDRLLPQLVERIMTTVDADSCEIYAIEDGRLRLLSGFDRAGFSDEWLGWTDDLAHYPATAAAVAAGDVLVVEDLSDPRLSEFERGRLAELDLLSEVCVPLIVEDRTVGTIDIFDTKPRNFRESLDFLLSMAPVLAGALDAALLVDRLQATTRDLRLLLGSGLDFSSSLELEDVMATVAARMSAVAEAEWCDIYSVEGDQMKALVAYGSGRVLDGFAGRLFPWHELAFCRRAIETGEPAACRDVLSDPEASERDVASAADWEYRAELEVPLIVRGRVVGLASLFAAKPRAFEHPDLLRGLATMAAQAVVNASLYRELDQSARRMSLVAGSSLELSASLDLESVLVAAARSLSAVSGFVDCDVYRVREDRVECVVSLIDGNPCREWLGQTRTLAEWPTMERAIVQGSPIVVSSPDDPAIVPKERQEMIDWGEKATLVVPLMAKDQAVAIVELSDTEHERTFDAEELATVEAISSVAGVAIDNAMLYEDIKQMHLSNLKALSSALNAKDYYTLGHAARVAAYMVLLGKELRWPADLVQNVEEAAYLHDIGKIGVSDRILLKPGGLNAREWELMRQHPVFSADIIKPLFADELVLGVRHHHERYDGSGLPGRARGRCDS